MIQNMTDNVYYVYGHYRKDTNTLFYVGKGKGNRAFCKHGRNIYWNHIVQKTEYWVYFFEKNMSEKDAYHVEKGMITDLNPMANFTPGGEGNPTYGFLGGHHTEEHKKWISERLTGIKRTKTPEHIDKWKQSVSKKFDSILDAHTGIKYIGLRECSRQVCIPKSTLVKMIKRGYRFSRVKK